MTWSRFPISPVAALSRSNAVRGGPDSRSSRRAMRLLLLRMSGLRIMESTIATSSGWPKLTGMRPVASAMVPSATPNSPPIEMTMPVRSALNREPVKGRATSAATAVFSTTMAASQQTTVHSSPASRCTSSSIPTETKKSPSRMSRNGRMTDSIWCRYSVSASIMPARKAPRPGDSPARLETQAGASTTSSTASVKSSRSRLCAIS